MDLYEFELDWLDETEMWDFLSHCIFTAGAAVCTQVYSHTILQSSCQKLLKCQQYICTTNTHGWSNTLFC